MYLVIAGGEWDAEWGRQLMASPEIHSVIAADSGADRAVMSGRIPDVLIGDLDSVTQETLALCEKAGTVIRPYPPDKNETDLELALDWAHDQAGREEVVLAGAGGGRVDHWLGTVGLLMKYNELGRRVRMLDAASQAWVIGPGRQELTAWPERLLSVLPLCAEVEASSAGLRYALDHLVLYQKKPRGVSNVIEAQGPSWLEIHRGTALMVISNQSGLRAQPQKNPHNADPYADKSVDYIYRSVRE